MKLVELENVGGESMALWDFVRAITKLQLRKNMMWPCLPIGKAFGSSFSPI